MLKRLWLGAPRGVDLAVWATAMGNAAMDYRGPATDEPYVRERLAALVMRLRADYRGDHELRAARARQAEADTEVERRAAEAEAMVARARGPMAAGRAAGTGDDVESRALRHEAGSAHRDIRDAEDRLDQARAVARDAAVDADSRLQVVVDRMAVAAGAAVAEVNAYLAILNGMVGEARHEPLGDDVIEGLLRRATQPFDLT